MATSTFRSKSTALEVVKGLNAKLNRKVVIITGIGLETARALSYAKAHTVITVRDINKDNNQVEVMEMDCTSLQSVRNIVSQFRTRQLLVHILICNAGITAHPYLKTVDGFELHFDVNHLAHLLLTTSLLSELKEGKPSRVIISKTANILVAQQFNKLYQSQGIRAYSLQPGGILTNLQQHIPEKEQRAMGWYKDDETLIAIFKTVQLGASTIVYAALTPELDNYSGEYLVDCTISKGINPDKTVLGIAPHAADMEAVEHLWKLSAQIVSGKE
ncbi:unnamed protein product [Rotaria sordida]|uniref:Uncharacterized protein n=1 Tax=Rotaria sordida TaxID=392033 RepID=A0A814B687_9BILA|nr:unnamed protein product [Rotaria sordida]CAF1278562.1 unnamed protein product [Rotaria sordida]CAF3522818.1 unnamed protein product [Rotaria sordida]CAF3649140.1 unnamed protein product [Rotaria sordida]